MLESKILAKILFDNFKEQGFCNVAIQILSYTVVNELFNQTQFSNSDKSENNDFENYKDKVKSEINLLVS